MGKKALRKVKKRITALEAQVQDLLERTDGIEVFLSQPVEEIIVNMPDFAGPQSN